MVARDGAPRGGSAHTGFARAASGWTLGVLVVALAASGVTPADAGSSPARPPSGVARKIGQPEEFLSRAEAHDLLDAELGDLVKRSGELLGMSIHAGPSVVLDSPVVSSRGLPPRLFRGVTVVHSAITQAEPLVRKAILEDPETLMGSLARLLTDGSFTLDGDAIDAQTFIPTIASLAEKIDGRRLYQAGLLVAHSLDAALPLLSTYAASLSRTGRAVSGCDVLDVSPALCVGGTGNNTYSADYALLVDLGGDDVHANAGGGGTLLNGRLPVSVAIDLEGNDRYVAPWAEAVHGSGALGVGVLVDVSGDDSYLVSSTRQGETVAAQGVGFGGVGILADLAGSDSYMTSLLTPAASAGSATAAQLRINAQAFAILESIGILLDAGEGNDSYSVKAAMTPAEVPGTPESVFLGSVTVFGQSFAAGASVSMLLDGGGSDAFSLEGTNASVERTDQRKVSCIPTSIVHGLATSQAGGVALAIVGPGDTKWSASSTIYSGQAEPCGGEGSNAEAFADIYAFGYSDFGLLGALYDLGGNDSFAARTTYEAIRELRITDECGCSNPTIGISPGDAVVLGMGTGRVGGTGILWDLSGDDRYAAETNATSAVSVVDERTGEAPRSEGTRAEATSLFADGWVQGTGEIGGVGILRDDEGDDSYSYHGTTRASAQVSAQFPEVLPPEAIAQTGPARTWVQGSGLRGGFGELRDSGGVDSYKSVSRSEAEAIPATRATSGIVISSSQGSVEGWGRDRSGNGVPSSALLWDLDSVEGDSFLTIPSDPPCLGIRGIGIWMDCGPGIGLGISHS